MTVHHNRAAKRRLPKHERIALTVAQRPNRLVSGLYARRAGLRSAFCTVNVLDDFNRQSGHSAVASAIISARLVRIFAHSTREHGLRKGIWTDDGSAFLGGAFKQWRKDTGVD